MSEPKLSIPAAIVIAGAMVSVAVFFGLRTGPRSASSDVGGPATAQRSAPPPSSDIKRVEAPAEPAKVDLQRVSQDAKASLELQRAALTKLCWEPLTKGEAANPQAPPPARPGYIDYSIDVTFDAKGAQLARGMSEERRTARLEVTACVSSHMKPLSVPAPGAVVRVEVPFRLP